jgi:1-deoxy-D-xylulose-5-phosphate reductoisomerase
VSSNGWDHLRTDVAKENVLARRVSILGSTGTVGAATLDVIRTARERLGEDVFPVEALTAQRNAAKLAEQALEFRPRAVVIADTSFKAELESALGGSGIEVMAGEGAIVEAAQRPAQTVMAAIVGAAGLAPTFAAVERGAIVALANKECAVAAGSVLRRLTATSGATLVPVDSEHNAAFQLLDFTNIEAIEKLTLTASGGPFRTWTLEQMAIATPEQAISHPNWNMGAKISVDSATLMNKGLELIEAQILFGLTPDQLDVVIHPQSLVHCLVGYSDGAVLAHLSAPDMRTPIAHALGWPRRLPSPARRLDFTELMSLTFEKPDFVRFPCFQLARDCLRRGGPAPTILNAANEVAVGHFLARKLGFLGIANTVERTLDMLQQEMSGLAPATLEDVLALDAVTRRVAREVCELEAA